MAHRMLRDRQASSTAADTATGSSAVQPTTTIALSTTFTPPASCLQNSLTIMPPPWYLIWANEPVPFPGSTITDCYPSEFLQSYTSVSSGTVGSSIVPVMSPLVCPQNFCVQFARDNYMACCPSGYKLAEPSDPVIASRPAYGGTCYSDFSVSVTATAVAYDDNGSTRLQPWSAETSGAQAYAHPIDGFSEGKASVGCAAAVSSLLTDSASTPSGAVSSSTAGASSSAAFASSTMSTKRPSGTPKGTIAGAVIAALVGLALVLGLILFLLRRHRKKQSQAPEIHQIGDDPNGGRHEKEGGFVVAESDAGVAAAELTGRSEKYANRASGLNSGWGAHELDAEVAHELPANHK